MAIDSKIRAIIDDLGYIKIDEMIRQAMSANFSSYYRSQKSIGADGDFITAPEISQLFGETIGFWMVSKWQELGYPKELALIELGGGQGSLMSILMRVAKLEPLLQKNLEVIFFEINSNFINKQKKSLEPYGAKVKWIQNIDQLPKKPCIIVSNEFFDALPIKQYIKVKKRWYESVLVSDPLDGRLKFDKIELHKSLFNQLINDYKNAEDGAVIEESLESLEIMHKISAHIMKFRGACLTIDYGYNIDPSFRTRAQFNSTLQAIKNHKYATIIDSLGDSDLSAHVDFHALKDACSQEGIKEINIFSQRDFLIQYGIKLRQNLLKQKVTIEEAKILDNQLERLIDPNQMGEIFKVMEFGVF